ncbi:MAG: hypothetical protein GFH27_549283n390 [Chloroflexi bacterium AL-W]|nr:hypothetical protein [Chloroflexi bacterium AL-N1]NOK64488.1 hypothetical protein [Chloroflexi bacterium AL-N10]NOK75730.1 hypothetical protein [Chloroflexi bacterium AL-N5]NOK80511.1 hypothetical protein [Chloroflexi bacterium AL-W]NOK87025.1 hypothetical protein [Chloroflexi bacterium AL-N15]
MVTEELLYITEVADELRVTRKTIYDWMRTERLDYVRVGGRRRIRRSELNRFIQVMRNQSPEHTKAPEPHI